MEAPLLARIFAEFLQPGNGSLELVLVLMRTQPKIVLKEIKRNESVLKRTDSEHLHTSCTMVRNESTRAARQLLE